MTELELEVEELRRKLNELADRVRLSAVAEAFMRGSHEIRERDYFLLSPHVPTRLTNVSSDGKWTYWDGHHVSEPHRIPEQGEYERLYTIAEVAEIVAKVKAESQGASRGGSERTTASCSQNADGRSAEPHEWRRGHPESVACALCGWAPSAAIHGAHLRVAPRDRLRTLLAEVLEEWELACECASCNRTAGSAILRRIAEIRGEAGVVKRKP
jgi:hypothetical protein